MNNIDEKLEIITDEKEKYYQLFPAIIKQKIKEGKLIFPFNTLFEYQPILVYRAVERKKEDFHEITLEDFKSYFQLNKTPKSARGIKKNWESDPHYYGVSSFVDEEKVRQLMKFPNPRKKMAIGYVFSEGGPQETRLTDKHVCWWLYEGTDVSSFKIKEDS